MKGWWKLRWGVPLQPHQLSYWFYLCKEQSGYSVKLLLASVLRWTATRRRASPALEVPTSPSLCSPTVLWLLDQISVNLFWVFSSITLVSDPPFPIQCHCENSSLAFPLVHASQRRLLFQETWKNLQFRHSFATFFPTFCSMILALCTKCVITAYGTMRSEFYFNRWN